MKLSTRQRQIIEMLIKSEHELTAAEIAHEIQVSPRTIHRGLLEIEEILREFDVSLHKKAGTGIQLQAAPEQLRKLQDTIQQLDTSEYTAEERKVLIACKLLENDEPVKLFSLSYDLQAAIPTIRNDLDELEDWIINNGITLIRKRGYGVEIAGTERAKRRAISILAQDHLDDSVLFGSHAESTISDPVSQQLLDMVGRDQFFQIEKALWKLDEIRPTSLSESRYTKLLIRLSIHLTRYHRGKRVHADEILEQEWNNVSADKKLYNIVTEYLQLKLPPEEEAIIIDLLKQWNDSTNLNQDIQFYKDFIHLDMISQLIREVGQRVDVNFDQDRSLKEGLLQHIVPVYQKIQNGEYIRNPLVSQIKKDYAKLFESVAASVRQVFREISIPDEEVGYLVMHFGAALERIQQISMRVKALLVCTSGIGSSKLLAVRIQKELPQIDLLAHISWYEVTRVPRNDYDIIISTVDLPLLADQYIKISPLLTSDEVDKLRDFIQNTPVLQLWATQDSKDSKKSLSLLTDIGTYSQIIVRLMDQFKVHTLSIPQEIKVIELRSVVEEMCQFAQQHGNMTHIQQVVDRLLEREHLGTQVLSNSGVALFHTRHEAVQQPILHLFRFHQPIQWQGLTDQTVDQILLMLGPKEMDKQTLEILSEFSVMLLEPGVVKRLKRDEESSIKSFFTKKFEWFIKSKLKWGE